MFSLADSTFHLFPDEPLDALLWVSVGRTLAVQHELLWCPSASLLFAVLKQMQDKPNTE